MPGPAGPEEWSGNPYLPEGVYIPDGEVHVFGDRMYAVGSQDRFGGPLFCMEDYEVWSAPLDDPTSWTRHGVAYRKEQDPYNDGAHPNPAKGAENGMHCLYAPDVCCGVDGRYYLYYCLDTVSRVGVAVADDPAGPYAFSTTCAPRTAASWASGRMTSCSSIRPSSSARDGCSSTPVTAR